MSNEKPITQHHQPVGVPALEMTGERTLPDVPQENYWYQRHLVVYEWVANRVRGQRAIDMACGEGYGADLMATTAAGVVGVDANPEAYEHARLKYSRSNLKFVRELIEDYGSEADTVVFLQTIEHVREPEALLEHFLSLVPEDSGELIVSTPNVLTLAAPGKSRSDNPWHVKEYRPEEFKLLLEAHAQQVELYGLFNAGKLAVHQAISGRLGLPHDVMHRHSGWAGLLYPALVRRISVRDFTLRRTSEIDELADALDLIAVVRR
jgi:SAM-dependent methyltransferase